MLYLEGGTAAFWAKKVPCLLLFESILWRRLFKIRKQLSGWFPPCKRLKKSYAYALTFLEKKRKSKKKKKEERQQVSKGDRKIKSYGRSCFVSLRIQLCFHCWRNILTYLCGIALRFVSCILRASLVHQVRDSIAHDGIYCPPETAVLLASFSLQVKYGDYRPDVHQPGYFSSDTLLPARLVLLPPRRLFIFVHDTLMNMDVNRAQK